MTNNELANGMRLEGGYENDRNATHSDLYKAIIREACGVTDVIIAHHLVYVTSIKDPEGFTLTIVEEVPSADTLIFDHKIAQTIWGDEYKAILARLACEPVETRDALLGFLFHCRGK